MRLVLMRHSIAAEPQSGETDRVRRLTGAGELRARRAGRLLCRLGIVPSEILASPYIRAAQTATHVGESFPLVPVSQWDELEPDRDLFEDLRAPLAPFLSTDATLVLVTHQPSVSFLALLLAVARKDIPQSFDPGTMIVFSLQEWTKRAATVTMVATGDLIDREKL